MGKKADDNIVEEHAKKVKTKEERIQEKQRKIKEMLEKVLHLFLGLFDNLTEIRFFFSTKMTHCLLNFWKLIHPSKP